MANIAAERLNGVGLDTASSLPSPTLQAGVVKGTSALSSRITSILSASYADLDIRDALETLDARGIKNNQETRRQLRLDVQREMIRCNGEIVEDFGKVAEVKLPKYIYVYTFGNVTTLIEC
jgi:conserved oligomeric Golgi complex subunit 6